jgi:hypothetical protein
MGYSLTILGFFLVLFVDRVVVNHCNHLPPCEEHVCDDSVKGPAPCAHVFSIECDEDESVTVSAPNTVMDVGSGKPGLTIGDDSTKKLVSEKTKHNELRFCVVLLPRRGLYI